MGILGLFNVIVNTTGDFKDKKLTDVGEEIKLTQLQGKTICFDASNMIYAAILALTHVKGMADATGKITSHIKTIMAQVLMFKKHKINQIWIFDNPNANDIKGPVLAKRAKKREESTYEKVQFKMTSEHVEDIKKLLSLLGIIYIIAPPGIEAEQYGAYLTIPKPGMGAMCEYMYSGDGDVLVFGGNLLRPLYQTSESGKSKKKIYKAFKIETVLEALDMNREQLATMATALGCDFAETKVKGIGPKTAAKQARIENIILDDEQRDARDYFLLDVTNQRPEIIRSDPDHETLTSWLTTLGFDQERLKTQLL
jgi:flap endonuclease-1